MAKYLVDIVDKTPSAATAETGTTTALAAPDSAVVDSGLAHTLTQAIAASTPEAPTLERDKPIVYDRALPPEQQDQRLVERMERGPQVNDIIWTSCTGTHIAKVDGGVIYFADREDRPVKVTDLVPTLEGLTHQFNDRWLYSPVKPPLTPEEKIAENCGKALQIFAENFGMTNASSVKEALSILTKGSGEIRGLFNDGPIFFFPPKDRVRNPEMPKVWVPRASDKEEQEIRQLFEEANVDVYLEIA